MATSSGAGSPHSHSFFPPGNPLTEADFEAIRATWAVCFGSAEDCGRLVLIRHYTAEMEGFWITKIWMLRKFYRFFSEYPESKKYFKSIPTEGDLQRNREVGLHGKRVMVALDQIIANWNNPPRLDKLTKSLVASHRDKHGVPFEMFKFLFQTFLMVFQDHLGETFTKGPMASWQKLFAAIQREIQNAYISQPTT